MAILQKGKFASLLEEISRRCVDVNQSVEKYITHPTFGLLYSVCLLEHDLELFIPLYGMRLFFLSATNPTAGSELQPISGKVACQMMEKHLSHLLHIGKYQEHEKVHAKYQQIFVGKGSIMYRRSPFDVPGEPLNKACSAASTKNYPLSLSR